jgi:hypothetical protein
MPLIPLPLSSSSLQRGGAPTAGLASDGIDDAHGFGSTAPLTEVMEHGVGTAPLGCARLVDQRRWLSGGAAS